MSADALREPQRYEVELPGGVEAFDARQVRDLIRNGVITPETSLRVAGGSDWRLAGEHAELRRYLDLAMKNRESKTVKKGPSVSPKRLIIYLALAGLGAGALMSLLAPICLIIGVFAKFVLSFAAFGAVLALGINNAVGEEDTRLINISAGAFALGGLIAWALAANRQFTPMHLAIIGLVGSAGLTWALGLQLKRAVPVVITALLFFPISVLLIRVVVPQGEIAIGGVGLLLLPLLIFVPALPFALFGGVLGAVMAMTGERL